MKTILMSSVTSLMLSSLTLSAVAQANDYSELRKQLDIMTSIADTAFAQASERSFSNVRYRYLADQGVVFTVRAHSGLEHRYEFAHRITPPPMPENFEHDIGMAVEEGMAVAREVMRGVRAGDFDFDFSDVQIRSDEMRQRSEEMRELAWELRDINREERDLTFELRNAPDEEKTELEQELTDVQKRKKELLDQQKVIETEIDKLADEQAEKIAARQQERQQKQQNLVADFEQQMGEILCDYGQTLRALPENQRVSVILEGVQDPANREFKERIYVFKKSELMACAGNSNHSDLIDNAVSYYF